MLYNLNLNFGNLNTLMLCLSIYNRMTPPTQHQFYPLLEVVYDDPHRAHFLTDTDAEVPLPPSKAPHRRWLHLVGYLERILSSETCRLMNQWKCYVATCQLAHWLQLFASYSFQCVAAALVVVYSTDISSCLIGMEAGRLPSTSRSCHAVGLGVSVPRRGLWRGRTWA